MDWAAKFARQIVDGVCAALGLDPKRDRTQAYECLEIWIRATFRPHDERVTELLEANNRLLWANRDLTARAESAEAELAKRHDLPMALPPTVTAELQGYKPEIINRESHT